LLISGDKSQVKNLRRGSKETVCGVGVEMKMMRRKYDLVGKRSFSVNPCEGLW
jgi:hypothetical protein